MSGCNALSGTRGLASQVLLGVASLAALLLKYMLSDKNRTFRQFAGDASKQVVGGLVLHVLNVAFAQGVLSSMTSAKTDQCAWYLVQVVLDDTVGVCIAFNIFHMMLGLLKWLGKQQLVWDLVRSETKRHDTTELPLLTPGGPNSPGMTCLTYVKQVVFWVIVAISMKISMMFIMFILGSPLQLITAKMQTFMHGNLLLEMVLLPTVSTVFNVIQYWLVDEIFLDAFKAESLKHDHHRLTVRNDEKEQHIDNLEQRLRDKDKEHDKCIREVSEQMRAQADQFEAEKNRLKGENQDLKQRNSDILMQLQQKVAMEGEVIAGYLGKIEMLEKDVGQLSSDKEEAMQKFASLNAKILQLYAESAQKDRKINELSEEKRNDAAGIPGFGFLNRILRPAATGR